MNNKIPVHLLFCLTYLLLRNGSCSETSSAPPSSPSKESPLEATRQELLHLGIDFATVSFAEEEKLEKWERVSKQFPRLDNVSNLGDFNSRKCELCWFLDIINFDQVVSCIDKRNEVGKKLDEKVLVNAFADRHAFELGQLSVQGRSHIEDELELRHHAKGLVSLEGSAGASVAPYIFLQHSLKLLKKNPESLELQSMFKNMMTLHLSSHAHSSRTKGAISAIYAALKVDVPTLLFVDLPQHAAAGVVTLRSNGTYDVVLINSGGGIENHQTKYSVKVKGFHKANYFGALPMTFVPTIEFKGITEQQLRNANYHFGSTEKVYYMDQPEVKAVKKQYTMPWEFTDSQGIGSCTFSSIWYTLRFYYQALAFENDIRLSLLRQAISETVELQTEIQKIDDELDADYFRRRNVSSETPYYSETVKKLWDGKDKLQDKLRMRRELIVVGLNGILQHLITLFHELDDIRSKKIFWEDDKSKSKWVAKEMLKKASVREELLGKAIPRIMTSFHAFWAEQQSLCASNLEGMGVEDESRTQKCMSWIAIEDDIRTLYGDAVKLVEGTDLELVKGQLGTRSTKKNEPLNVHSLPVHESLRLILDRITIGGDSATLRTAIAEHLQSHSGHPRVNETNYLLVLYAALSQSASLLDFLVNDRGLPLVYRFYAIVPKDHLMLLSDLENEEDIPVFAVLEFKNYGQPLDNFPQLLTLTSGPAKNVVDKFVQEYHRSIPANDYDAALAEFAENRELALLAHTAPKASAQAREDLFMRSDDVRVLSILLATASHTQVKAKLDKVFLQGNGAIVELLLNRWFREERLLKVSESVKKDVVVPEEWILGASRGQLLDVLRQLLPYSDPQHVDNCLLDVASRGYTDVAILLAGRSSDQVPDAIYESIGNGHPELARALVRLYPSKDNIQSAFIESAKCGNADLVREYINTLEMESIQSAIKLATRYEKFEIVEMLFEYVPLVTIQEIALTMIGKEAASTVFVKALTCIPDYAPSLFYQALDLADYKAIHVLLPFLTLENIGTAFSRACKEKNDVVVSLLSAWPNATLIDACFERLVDRRTASAELLEKLLPRVSRGKIFKIHKSPEKMSSLQESTRVAISKRVEGIPAEIALLHAFQIGASWYTFIRSKFAAEEAKKYGIDPPTCASFEECAKDVKLSGAQILDAAVGEAMTLIDIVYSDDELAQRVPLLIPFATQFVCTHLIKSSRGITLLVPEVATVCAGKALEYAILQECENAVYDEAFETLNVLLPHLSLPRILSILQRSIFWKKLEVVDRILDMLNNDQVDSLLSLATRAHIENCDFDDGTVLLFTSLLKRASKSAIDASLMVVSRYTFGCKQFSKMLSESATGEGREAAAQLKKQIRKKDNVSW